MSLKRSNSGGRSLGGGGGDAAGKVDRQELFDELKRLAASGGSFTPVDIALAIGAAEPVVSKSLLGLVAEGYLERVEGGQYRAMPMAEMSQAEFVKAYARASKVDSTRQRDLSEIGRLKQNNDVMRQRLLTAISERDHYLGLLKARGIDPGTPPTPSPAPPAVAGAPVATGRATGRMDNRADEEAAPGAVGLAVPSPRSESERMPSGPGDAGPADSSS
ncbi:MAG: hypothetical protein ABIS92_01675 [Polyangia bacterium]